jgi:hypothetical protein
MPFQTLALAEEATMDSEERELRTIATGFSGQYRYL